MSAPESESESDSDACLKEEAETMMVGYTSKFKGLPVMHSQQISDLLTKDGEEILLVDVREDEEMLVSMIPTAISKKEFLSLKSQLPKSTRIVPYCKTFINCIIMSHFD